MVHLVKCTYRNRNKKNWSKNSKFLEEYPEDIGGKRWRMERKKTEKYMKYKYSKSNKKM